MPDNFPIQQKDRFFVGNLFNFIQKTTQLFLNGKLSGKPATPLYLKSSMLMVSVESALDKISPVFRQTHRVQDVSGH